ncbi:MAG: hypothetical protein FWG42_02955 [Clostridiales bacterium]|nr:hypothetical protein [Clostridiales bacterium]
MKLNSNELLLSFMSAISVIFKIGFIPSADTISKLAKAAEFLCLYAEKEGCGSYDSDDILAFAAERFPAFFSVGTQFEGSHVKTLLPGEKPATPQTEWLSLISSILRADESLSIKMTVREEAAAAAAY